MKVFIVNYDACFDGEKYTDQKAYEDKAEALAAAKAAWEELCKQNDDFDGWEIDTDEETGYFEAYEEGWYDDNHVCIDVGSKELVKSKKKG